MKRNMDLARSILLEVERRPYPIQKAEKLSIEGYSDEEITYHIILLIEGGFISYSKIHGKGYPERLTWEGHEFLESSRDEGLWKKAKKIMAEKAGGITFEALKQVLIQLAKDAVSGP